VKFILELFRVEIFIVAHMLLLYPPWRLYLLALMSTVPLRKSAPLRGG